MNESKIIRFATTFYQLAKQEIVLMFSRGSTIFSKNQKDRSTKTIQQKVIEQKWCYEN